MPSSFASLNPPLLPDLADDLWFYRSFVPFPSLCDVPCLRALFSPPPPDPSTLLAECMIAKLTFSRRRNTDHANTFGADKYGGACLGNYNETAYGGYSSFSDTDDYDWADDEEYYSAPSDWADEDSYNGCHGPCNSGNERVKVEMLPAPRLRTNVEPIDRVSWISDQELKRKEDVAYPLINGDNKVASGVRISAESASIADQATGRHEGDNKYVRSIYAVASAAPWKAAAKGRPLLVIK
ncbi:hypothetical protein GOP47_0020681 [Adiantum capillus-veneris]|uniref:Uncharacterized protein n=1 Tax=Adiantum capillus-veneris TaxID=13818 RepID=A0A9D4U9L3_ADICA|nr:hypothetical protein GOP47_0020681 [Adiantum capillus-veneris]